MEREELMVIGLARQNVYQAPPAVSSDTNFVLAHQLSINSSAPYLVLFIRGPNLFFKYFFSFLGLAYFPPLGCLLRFKFHGGSLVGPLTLLNPSEHPKGV